jgi:hypothetical protein
MMLMVLIGPSIVYNLASGFLLASDLDLHRPTELIH